MRIESSVTAISWIPSESIEGMTKLPFEAGFFNYDAPLPDHVDDLDRLHEEGAFREANELRAWIEVQDGKIVDCGHAGRALLGTTRMRIGPVGVGIPGIAMPLLRPEPEVDPTYVTFQQTAGGRMALPAPRRVSRKPYFQMKSSLAWSTLGLTIHVDGRVEYGLLGASPFPRHWVYGPSGDLVAKSGTIDFDAWYRGAFGKYSPWGETDSPALVTEVESALERRLSHLLMQTSPRPKVRRLRQGHTLVEQGEEGEDLYLLLDGVLAVEVDGEPVTELGPGSIVGERAAVEQGVRTATLRAATPCKVAVGSPRGFPIEELKGVARLHGSAV